MADSSYRQTLGYRGLQPFLWTQFLGAFNDNLFKIVVSMLAGSFVSSSASLGQDRFQFAELMAANARAHEGQLLTRNFERVCWDESLGAGRPNSGRMPVCRRGG